MTAIDTNLLFYCLDPSEPVKQELAARLLETLPELVLPWQVLCELANGLTKLEKKGLEREKGRAYLRNIQRKYPILMPQAPSLQRDLDLQQKYSLSFWDANLVAACLEGAVKTLYSEDITGHPQIEGLTLVNPFAQEVAR